MKKLLFVLLFAPLFSCNSSHSFEAKIQKFMKDSVVPTFNDPSSYEFVSMEIDTLKGGDYIKNLRQLYKIEDTTIMSKETILTNIKEADSLDKLATYKDSIFHININIKCRGKNKFGGLILNDVKFKYFPSTDRIQQ